MKRFASLLFALALALPATFACAAEFDGTLTLMGSSTLGPVISQVAKTLADEKKTWNAVDPSLPAVPIKIVVAGSGSGEGIKAVVENSANFGLISRPLSEKEKTSIDGLKAYLLGTDALTISVNPANEIAKLRDGLSTEELAKIFGGEYATWNDLDAKLPKDPIVAVIRDIGGGAHKVFQDAVLKDKPVRKDAIQAPSMGALVTKIIENKNAIGYASSGISAQNEGKLVPLAVDGVKPTNENINSGLYKISRPLLVLKKGELTAPEKAFVDVLLSPAGMKIVSDMGFVPAK